MNNCELQRRQRHQQLILLVDCFGEGVVEDGIREGAILCLYPEGGDVTIGDGAELVHRGIQVEEIDLVAGLGEGDFLSVLQDEGDGGVRVDGVLFFGAQLEGQVDVFLRSGLVVEMAEDDVVFEGFPVSDQGIGGGQDAGSLVRTAGRLDLQVDGGGRCFIDGCAMSFQKGGESVILEIVLQIVVRIPAGGQFDGLDAPGEFFHVGRLQGVAEPVEIQSVLQAAFRGAFPADLVGPDEGAVGKGGRHFHALGGGESGFLPQVHEEEIHRGPVREADEFNADVHVLELFGHGGNMGHPFGPVVGPDLLGGEGERGREDRQGKEHLFHHWLQIYTISAGKRNFFVSLSG